MSLKSELCLILVVCCNTCAGWNKECRVLQFIAELQSLIYLIYSCESLKSESCLVGAIVNLLLDGLVHSGNLVQDCFDMFLQSWEILLEHGVTVSQCFSCVFIQACSKITDL